MIINDAILNAEALIAEGILHPFDVDHVYLTQPHLLLAMTALEKYLAQCSPSTDGFTIDARDIARNGQVTLGPREVCVLARHHGFKITREAEYRTTPAPRVFTDGAIESPDDAVHKKRVGTKFAIALDPPRQFKIERNPDPPKQYYPKRDQPHPPQHPTHKPWCAYGAGGWPPITIYTDVHGREYIRHRVFVGLHIVLFKDEGFWDIFWTDSDPLIMEVWFNGEKCDELLEKGW